MEIKAEEGVEKALGTKKDQILQAAARCFVEEGFHGSSMSRISKAAGMSVGHIYHYFASKDEIIAALVRDEECRATDKIAYFSSLDRDKLVDGLMTKIEDGVRMNTDLFHSVLMMEILAEAARNPGIAEIVRELDADMRSSFASILRDRLGLEDAESRVEALFTIFSGLAIRIIRNPDIDRQQLIPVIKSAIRHILES